PFPPCKRDRESERRYAVRKDPRAQRNGCPRRLRACEFLLDRIFEWKDQAVLINRSAVPHFLAQTISSTTPVPLSSPKARAVRSIAVNLCGSGTSRRRGRAP